MIGTLALHLMPLVSWIVLASVKSIAVTMAVLLCRHLFSRWLSAQARFTLWLAVVASLSFPFGFETDARFLSSPIALFGEVQRSVPQKNDRDAIAVPSAARIAADVNVANLSAEHEQTFSSTSYVTSDEWLAASTGGAICFWLLAVWLSIALGLLALVLTNLLRYFRLKSVAHEATVVTGKLFQQCKAQLGLERTVRLLESPQIHSPMLFGWWSPTLLLPKDLAAQLNSDQLRHVFLHELAHVQRQDVLVNWLTSLVQIAHWFNPIVWYAMRSMRADMEQACDAKVINCLTRAEQLDYGNTLLELTDFNSRRMLLSQSVGIVENHSQLKARIIMIQNFNAKGVRNSIFAAFLFTAVASAAITQPRIDTDSAEKSATDVVNVVDHAVSEHNTPAPSRSAAATTAAEKPKSPTQNSRVQTEQTPSPSSKRTASAPLNVEYLKIHYVQASDLVALINSSTGISLLSEHGRVVADARTNTLIVHDSADRLTDIRRLVATLDVALDKIQIEAHIAIVNDGFLQNLRVDAKTNPAKFDAAALAWHYDIAAELSAAQADHLAEVISAPRLIVENRKEATIEQGFEVPYVAANSVTAVFKKVALSLKVTPRVALDNRIALDITILKESIDPVSTAASDAPQPRDTRKIHTETLLNDSQTIVLGGILELDERDSVGAVSATPNPNKKRQLVVFLTPRIVHESVARTN